MSILLMFSDTLWIRLDSVESIVLSGEFQYTITCFGNQPVLHKKVMFIQIIG